MCRVERVLRTLCLELSRLCLKYHHQRIRDHQNGTDAGLGFWVIGLPDFFSFSFGFVVSRLTNQTGFERILLYESSPAETRLTVYRRLSVFEAS